MHAEDAASTWMKDLGSEPYQTFCCDLLIEWAFDQEAIFTSSIEEKQEE